MLEQSCKIEKFHNSILLSVYCEKCFGFFLSDDTCMFFKKEKKRNHLICRGAFAKDTQNLTSLNYLFLG